MVKLKRLIRGLTPPVLYEYASSIVRRKTILPAENPCAAEIQTVPLVAPNDATAVIDIHGVPIRMDRNHALPHYVAGHPLYDSSIGYIVRHLHDAAKRPITVVDVGANIGDTACLAARLVSKDDVEFVCIEGSEDFMDLLRENTQNLRAEIVHAIAGDKTTVVNKRVVTLNVGTAFVADGGSSLETSLDSIVGARHVDLIKIDTDGYEMQVLRGSTETIERCDPALFLEFSPHHIRTYGGIEPREILKHLSRLGYGDALVYDNFGHVIGVLPLLGEAMDVLTTYSESRAGFYLDMYLSGDEISLRSLAASEAVRTNTVDASGY